MKVYIIYVHGELYKVETRNKVNLSEIFKRVATRQYSRSEGYVYHDYNLLYCIYKNLHKNYSQILL